MSLRRFQQRASCSAPNHKIHPTSNSFLEMSHLTWDYRQQSLSFILITVASEQWRQVCLSCDKPAVPTQFNIWGLLQPPPGPQHDPPPERKNIHRTTILSCFPWVLWPNVHFFRALRVQTSYSSSPGREDFIALSESWIKNNPEHKLSQATRGASFLIHIKRPVSYKKINESCQLPLSEKNCVGERKQAAGGFVCSVLWSHESTSLLLQSVVTWFPSEQETTGPFQCQASVWHMMSVRLILCCCSIWNPPPVLIPPWVYGYESLRVKDEILLRCPGAGGRETCFHM